MNLGTSLSFDCFQFLPDQRRLLRSGDDVRLGSRALDILLALASRPGQVIANDELMRLVWPGIHVDETNLRVHISALKKVLRQADGTNCIANVPGRGYCFVAPVRVDGATPITAAPPASPPRTSLLPRPAGPLVGRTTTLAAIVDELATQRLVTIVGPGGIGKTSVAVALAAQIAASHQDGVIFVDLSAIDDPQLVPSAVYSALGASSQPGASAGGLSQLVADRSALIVLDCCEHVIDAAASVAAALLDGSERLRIVATSREPLRIVGEWVHRLSPLAVPTEDDLTAEAALLHSAVALFAERASAALGGYRLGDGDAPHVIRICRRLDGIALAIELAAGRVASLGIEGLSQALDDGFRQLTRGRRTALPRHQTLQATLDWSYATLTAVEQVVLERLAVFSGGFTIKAARSVVPQTEPEQDALPEILADLAAKSLVAADLSGSAPRYRLLDMTRDFALGRLRSRAEFPAIEARHAHYMRELFEQAATEWEAAPSSDWLSCYGCEIGNLRCALEWAFSERGDGETGVALTIAAVPLWYQLSLVGECLERVRSALAELDRRGLPDPRSRMQLFAALGWPQMRATSGQPSGAAAWSKALALAQDIGDVDFQLRALWALWVDRMNTARPREALELATTFRQLASGANRPDDALIAERLLARPLHILGQQASAEHHVRLMLDHYAAPPGRAHIARFQYEQRITAQITLARVLWLRGRPDSALRAVEEMVNAALSAGHLLTLCHALADGACFVALLAGQLPLAERYVALLRSRTHKQFLDVWSTYADCFAGDLLARGGQPDEGAGMIEEGIAKLERTGFVLYRNAFSGSLAQALIASGRLERASAIVDTALVRCRDSGEAWYVPELLRLRGEICFQQGDEAAATEALADSLALAQEQGALAWQLRTGLLRARALCSAGRDRAAAELLRPIAGAFAEGFATPDLVSAAALLEELGTEAPAP